MGIIKLVNKIKSIYRTALQSTALTNASLCHFPFLSLDLHLNFIFIFERLPHLAEGLKRVFLDGTYKKSLNL